MRFWAVLMLSAALLQGCSETQSEALASEAPLNVPTANSAADGPVTDDVVIRFSDILDQYRALNERLENVASRLQIANAPLCPLTIRDPGYTVHTLSDYPPQLQQVAQTLLNVDAGLSVRTIRGGGPAALAGVQAGDRLMGINGQRFSGGLTQKTFYDNATETAFGAPTARLTIARNQGGNIADVMSFKLTPETICGYPAHVVFDEVVNGHTDGRAVWITSQLMRTVEDDDNLALIVAHEMAHAIARHLELTPSDEQRKVLELKADSMALVMLERAGFDIDSAIAYWMSADNPQRMSQSRSATHPNITQRLDNFEAARRAIQLSKRQNEPLYFSILPDPAL